jgi:CheY-like chemotaxis protein
MSVPMTLNRSAIDDCVTRNMGMPILDAETGRATALRVLIVEDDAADLYLLQAVLATNPWVHDISVARDGAEALELIDSGAVDPDLAIIDLHMPRKDGFSLLLELRLRGGATFPAVVLTSSRSSPDALRSRNRGAEMFLVKPDSVQQLTALMAEVIAIL